MSTPSVGADYGSFHAEWGKPELVRIEVDHVRTDRQGDVVGEVTVYSLATAVPARLHASRVNLTSVRSRSELARYLKTRNGANGLDWQTMLESASVHTVDMFRR